MPVRVKSAGKAPALPFALPPPPAGYPQKPAGISLCMIVRDEEGFLARCLASVQDVVDEIIVVDTGSTDRTIEIARGFGAIIEQREWRNDFAWARNESIKLAKYRWILQLDADEELLEESKPALRQLKSAPAHVTGVWARCINRADQYRGNVGTISHAVVRIFPNTPRIRYYGLIHEFPALDGASTTVLAKASPVKFVHHGYMADVVQNRAKFDRNMTIIEAATQKDPGDPFNWYNLGMTAYLSGEHLRAAEAFERMRELSRAGARPFVPNGLTVLADTYTDFLGRPEDALTIAKEALALSPYYANAHFSAGRALHDLKRYQEAREMFLAAIADAPYIEKQFVADDDVPRWKSQNMIGGTYQAQGDEQTALQWFEEGLKNAPSVQPLRINQGNALERLGRIAEAAEVFMQLCVDLGDETSIVHYINFLLRHHPADALSVIEANYSKCSTQAAVALLLAAAAVVQRMKTGDGEHYLLLAQELASGSAEVLGPLELIYRQRGDTQAISRLREREQSVPPQSAADFARRSQIAASRNDFKGCLLLAQEGLQRFPGDAMLHYSAAAAHSRLGQNPQALSHLEAITELSGDLQWPVLLLRGNVLEALGRNDEAEQILRSAMQVNKRQAAIELGGFYMRAGRYADAKSIAEEALA